MPGIPAACAKEIPHFSVIVPLEAHRNQSLKCLKAWTHGQSYARERYEVIVLAPQDHNRRELDELASLLTEQDRLVLCDGHHDVVLVVAGAQEARGSVLFFTESHCWPDADVLEKTAAALQAHPEWAALSCGLEADTHNSLSVVEAEMYQSHMEQGMRDHPWRRILDPCFAVRREAYFLAGGFEPVLGHFAEWMLAARFFLLDLPIGHAPEAKVHHYYIGEMGELEEFTADFTRGEMLACARTPRDPCADIFSHPAEWTGRHQWSRRPAMAMTRLEWAVTLQAWQNSASLWEIIAPFRRMARWLPVAMAGVMPAWLGAMGRKSWAGLRLWWNMHFGPQNELKSTFLSYIASVVRAERLHFLRTCDRASMPVTDGSESVLPTTGTWEPGGEALTAVLGLHEVETWCGQPFCWSEPAALMELALPEGAFTFTFTWLLIRPPWLDFPPQFYFNEEPVPSTQKRAGEAEFEVEVRSAGPVRIGWTCPIFEGPGDTRLLGLPAGKLTWVKRGTFEASPIPQVPSSAFPQSAVTSGCQTA